MPEFLQEAVNGEDLGRALLQQLNDVPGRERLEAEFLKVHQQLRVGAADRAAQCHSGSAAGTWDLSWLST